MKGAIINAAFEIVRRPFLTRAERFLGRVGPNDQNETWSQMEARIQRIGDALILSALLTGYSWLATFAAAAFLGACIRMATQREEGLS